MRPPPIRYPLPTLLLVAALAIAARRGAGWAEGVKAAVADRWARATQGPGPTRSDTPIVVAGPMVRRVLLLRGDVPASATPGGEPTEVIRRRMFADVFDIWPTKGAIGHDRIGNRRPIGWVAAADVLAWDTRLVLRPPAGTLELSDNADGSGPAKVDVGAAALPVVGWAAGAVEVAVWEADAPWSAVARRGWLREADIPGSWWAVWLSRDELLELLKAGPEAPAQETRLRAILGRPAGLGAATAEGRRAAVAALPPAVAAGRAGEGSGGPGALARLNEQWAPEATWAGLSFRAVPLDAWP